MIPMTFIARAAKSVLFIALALAAAEAQTTSGAINGSVTDPSGAVIPNAQVTLTNLGTQDTRTLITNASGFYQFINIPPASYRISVTTKGFKKPYARADRAAGKFHHTSRYGVRAWK